MQASLTAQVKQEQVKLRYHTCLRLLLGGQDTPEVSLKEGCSLLGIRGEMSTVHDHQSQIRLLHSGKKESSLNYSPGIIHMIQQHFVKDFFSTLKFTLYESNGTNRDTKDWCTDESTDIRLDILILIIVCH